MGRKGGGKNTQARLFLSYLVRMAIFPSDILAPPKCHVSMYCCLDAIKASLGGEREESCALLTCCDRGFFFFFKAL